jgi:membrane protein CcdC involved in cytochrome C biogenesis
MVHETIFRVLSTYRQIIIIASAVIPATTLLISFAHGVYDGRRAPWRQIYALMVHIMTMAVAAVGAMVVYHILVVGSLTPDLLPIVPPIALAAGWLLTLGFVKRSVDFSMLRSIRNPFGLLLSWLLGWTVASVLAFGDIWLLPGPEYVTVLSAVLLVFLVVRVVLRLAFGSRDRE